MVAEIGSVGRVGMACKIKGKKGLMRESERKYVCVCVLKGNVKNRITKLGLKMLWTIEAPSSREERHTTNEKLMEGVPVKLAMYCVCV